MPLQLSNYNFDGPFYKISDIKDQPGIYAILTNIPRGVALLDIGESENVKTRIQNHDRKDEWNKHAQGTISAAVYYTNHLPPVSRKAIEHILRMSFKNLPCGER